MSKMLKYIRKNYGEISGYGKISEMEKDGIYLVIPLKIIKDEMNVTLSEILNGEE